MEWHDLFTAIALVFIIEGIIPFVNPSGLRRKLAMVSQLSDQQLRTTGFICMMIGVIALYILR